MKELAQNLEYLISSKSSKVFNSQTHPNNGFHHCLASLRSSPIFPKSFLGRMARNNSQNQFLSILSHAYRSNLLQFLLLTKYQTTKISKNKLSRKNAEFSHINYRSKLLYALPKISLFILLHQFTLSNLFNFCSGPHYFN